MADNERKNVLLTHLNKNSDNSVRYLTILNVFRRYVNDQYLKINENLAALKVPEVLLLRGILDNSKYICLGYDVLYMTYTIDLS